MIRVLFGSYMAFWCYYATASDNISASLILAAFVIIDAAMCYFQKDEAKYKRLIVFNLIFGTLFFLGCLAGYLIRNGPV